MGRDKSWLLVEGQSLLARQLALATAAGAEEVFISGRAGEDYSVFGKPVLVDMWAGCGPLGGIERGLAAAAHSLVLVLAVDLPYLELSLLKELLAQCTEHCGVVPVSERGIEPLAAPYPRAARSLAIQRLQGRQFAVRAFVEACRKRNLVSMLPVQPARRDFTNWNWPEDAAPRGRAAAEAGNSARHRPARPAAFSQPAPRTQAGGQ